MQLAPPVLGVELSICGSGVVGQYTGSDLPLEPVARFSSSTSTATAFADAERRVWTYCFYNEAREAIITYADPVERPMAFPASAANAPQVGTRLYAETSAFGPVPAEVARVMVAAPDGSVSEAALGDAFFAWIGARFDDNAARWTVTYLDAEGLVLDEVTMRAD